mmetsp:Transcript_15923/g.23852  ORF Transcript_15923/g.23852 Transcript_15923/m.23852 type:complete len:83 (-) Transcript_15923:85-333(-)
MGRNLGDEKDTQVKVDNVALVYGTVECAATILQRMKDEMSQKVDADIRSIRFMMTQHLFMKERKDVLKIFLLGSRNFDHGLF